jgi:hypothetical protein
VVALAGAVHPIHFLYGHLHNSIRTELDNLSNWVLALEADNEQDLHQRLRHLKERYHFLEQVYKYHSSVEDEVRCLFCCLHFIMMIFLCPRDMLTPGICLHILLLLCCCWMCSAGCVPSP